jgi:hypothetical protein
LSSAIVNTKGTLIFTIKTVLVIRLDAKNATCHWFWCKAGEKNLIFSLKIVVVITCHWCLCVSVEWQVAQIDIFQTLIAQITLFFCLATESTGRTEFF